MTSRRMGVGVGKGGRGGGRGREEVEGGRRWREGGGVGRLNAWFVQ